MDHRDSLVLITGAARGIGKAIAQAFASRGSRLCLADIREQELEETVSELTGDGATVIGIPTDVTKPEQVEALFDRAERELGPLEVQINNAGTFSYVGPVWEAPPDSWFRDVQVNLYGGFLCCRAGVRRMMERGHGYVVNMVASGGVGDPHAYSTGYASSKAGLMRLTEGLAAETRRLGIKVFGVAPPAVQSEMTRFLLEDEGARTWRPGFREAFADGAQWTDASRVAELCVALTAGDADELTGRYIRLEPALDELVRDSERIIANDLYTLRIRT